MTFKPSYSSSLPKTPFHEKASREPFISFIDPSIKVEPVFLPLALRPQGLYVAGNPGSGATINATGRFEYVYAQAAVGVASGTCTAVAGKVCIIGAGTGNGLINSYATVARNDTGVTGRRGQRAFQVIRVP